MARRDTPEVGDGGTQTSSLWTHGRERISKTAVERTTMLWCLSWAAATTSSRCDYSEMQAMLVSLAEIPHDVVGTE